MKSCYGLLLKHQENIFPGSVKNVLGPLGNETVTMYCELITKFCDRVLKKKCCDAISPDIKQNSGKK